MGLAGTPDLIYRRGNKRARLTLRRGRTRRMLETGDIVRIDDKEADWIATAADLKFSGRVFLPEIDDEIILVHGGKQYTYNVFSPDTQTSHYSPVDSEGFELRIHTRLTSIQ